MPRSQPRIAETTEHWSLMDRVEFDYWKPRDVARLLSLVEAERRYFQEMMAMLPVGVALLSPRPRSDDDQPRLPAHVGYRA